MSTPNPTGKPRCRICLFTEDPKFTDKKRDPGMLIGLGYVAGFVESRFISDSVAKSCCSEHAALMMSYAVMCGGTIAAMTNDPTLAPEEAAKKGAALVVGEEEATRISDELDRDAEKAKKEAN